MHVHSGVSVTSILILLVAVFKACGKPKLAQYTDMTTKQMCRYACVQQPWDQNVTAKLRSYHRYTGEIPDLGYLPCNGIISHGAQIGGLRVFANHTCKNKCKTSSLTIFVPRAAFYTCLSLRSDYSRCRWHTHPTNYSYFDYGKNSKTLNLSPMLWSKWRSFWNLPCISVDSIKNYKTLSHC